MAHQCHNVVLDPALMLNERATGTTTNATIVGATTGGTAIVIDLQQQARQYAGAPGATDTSAATSYAKFDVMIEWTGCESGTSQVYTWYLEGNVSDSTFASNNFRLATKSFGIANLGTFEPWDTPVAGRILVCANNAVINNTAGKTAAHGVVMANCRYIRCLVFCSNIAHTTGFAYRAFLVPKA